MSWLVRGATAVLGCVVLSSAAFAQEPEVARCFRIFDVTGFKGKPDLAAHGIEPAVVIYSPHHFWPGKKAMDRLPEKSVVQAVVDRQMTSRPPVPALVVLDLEHWPNVGSADVVASSVDKYVTLFHWVKERAGNRALGYYGISPLRDYWRAIKEPSSPQYRQWQAENDRFARLADVVDVLVPSLYTFYDHVEGWQQYAAANLREARRLARGKPVYAFIWPQYHDSNQKLKGQYVPGDFWLLQLRTIEALADGVVIWAGPGQWWDADAPWWQATMTFTHTSSRVCRSGVPVKPAAPEKLRGG